VAATLGQVCFTLAFTSGPPARVSVVGLMQIPFALGLDLVFGAPVLEWVTLAGIALVLAPTAWMMLDRASRQTGPAAGVQTSSASEPRTQCSGVSGDPGRQAAHPAPLRARL
jgi:hypothetical protein